MGFIFALLLMGLPLAAAYIDMLQSQGATKLGGFDLPKTGGYTPRWDGRKTVASTAPVAPTAPPPSPPPPNEAPSTA